MPKHKTLTKKLKTWLIWMLVFCGVLVVATIGFIYINLGLQNTSVYKGPRRITIQKRNGRYNFYKNGKAFSVEGAAGFSHIKELSECGANTIMCWDTSELPNTLKEATRNNIAVIIGLDIPGKDRNVPGKDMTFYSNQKNVTTLYKAYINIVRRYKDDPSVFAWCLGNELVFPLSLVPKPFYRAYNQILDSIHHIDPNHPVCTSIVNVSRRSIIMMKWKIPSLDFYCLNIYNSIKTLPHQLDLIKWIWQGPYLLGEWAPMGGWESPVTAWQSPIENTSTEKAELFYHFYTKYMPLKDPRFLGSLAFYWGSRYEYTNSWFSIFDKRGSPTEIEEALNDCWKDTVTIHDAPKIKYALIDNLTPEDNIIIESGSTNSTSLVLSSSVPPDKLQYSWQIFQEWSGAHTPPNVNRLFTDSTAQNPMFTAPSREGPYRVSVTVYNSKGYCATANIPIYVIKGNEL